MSAIESIRSHTDFSRGSGLLWEGPQCGHLPSPHRCPGAGSITPNRDTGTHMLYVAQPFKDPVCKELSHLPHLTHFSLQQTVEGVGVGTQQMCLCSFWLIGTVTISFKSRCKKMVVLWNQISSTFPENKLKFLQETLVTFQGTFLDTFSVYYLECVLCAPGTAPSDPRTSIRFVTCFHKAPALPSQF